MPQPATVPVFDPHELLPHRIFFSAADLPRFLERALAHVHRAMRLFA